MKNPLFPANASNEFLTRERCYITELFNVPEEARLSLARCRVTPGVTTELHCLAVDEWYYIEQGTGRMEVGDGQPFIVGPGDTVAIDRGVAQRIHNSGDIDLVFQCLCVPRFAVEHYQPLEAADN
jgi:mannose-6-phosphate isomerase-like protein (cupin superfamily)